MRRGPASVPPIGRRLWRPFLAQAARGILGVVVLSGPRPLGPCGGRGGRHKAGESWVGTQGRTFPFISIDSLSSVVESSPAARFPSRRRPPGMWSLLAWPHDQALGAPIFSPVGETEARSASCPAKVPRACGSRASVAFSLVRLLGKLGPAMQRAAQGPRDPCLLRSLGA